jgi:hypothetical protein
MATLEVLECKISMTRVGAVAVERKCDILVGQASCLFSYTESPEISSISVSMNFTSAHKRSNTLRHDGGPVFTGIPTNRNQYASSITFAQQFKFGTGGSSGSGMKQVVTSSAPTAVIWGNNTPNATVSTPRGSAVTANVAASVDSAGTCQVTQTRYAANGVSQGTSAPSNSKNLQIPRLANEASTEVHFDCTKADRKTRLLSRVRITWN